jgi:DNA-binding CsgD family transcriptional regulator
MGSMGKSDLLRVQDVRDAYRLIGECRDLGSDPALWQTRVLEGVCQVVGASAGAGGEGIFARPVHPIRPFSFLDIGFDTRGRERLVAYRREIGPEGDPIFRAIRNTLGLVVTRTRSQLVSDAEWYRSASFNYYRKPCGVDHCLTSVCRVSDDGAVSVITGHRGIGERDFSPREVRLMEFFHAELRPLIGRQLVSASEPGPWTLAPRLRETLACLMEGDSEKQVAARLGISHATVHQYVTALYRRFGVQSRGQLLAYVLKRSGSVAWSRIWGVMRSAGASESG